MENNIRNYIMITKYSNYTKHQICWKKNQEFIREFTNIMREFKNKILEFKNFFEKSRTKNYEKFLNSRIFFLKIFSVYHF